MHSKFRTAKDKNSRIGLHVVVFSLIAFNFVTSNAPQIFVVTHNRSLLFYLPDLTSPLPFGVHRSKSLLAVKLEYVVALGNLSLKMINIQ